MHDDAAPEQGPGTHVPVPHDEVAAERLARRDLLLLGLESARARRRIPEQMRRRLVERTRGADAAAAANSPAGNPRVPGD